MNQSPSWQFDEMKQVGKDYADIAEVEAYDARHGKFRNIEKENEDIIQTLSIQKHHAVIEFGTGTGAFAIQAAASARQVYAVDVSLAMLDYASLKAEKQGLTNMQFCHGGFLTYQHTADPVDHIVTSLALHHLPDFWKAIALKRLNAMLKPEGRLFLYDVVYSGENDEANLNAWVENQKNAGGLEAVEDVETHIREEYSTFTWIMASLLEKAGFRIDSTKYDRGVLAEYVCTKMADGTKSISSRKR